MEWIELPDRGAVAHLCRLMDEREQLIQSIEEAGVLLEKVIVSPKGDVVGRERYSNPSLRQLRMADPIILKLRASLGLDPISRQKMDLAPERAPDQLEEIQARFHRRRQEQAWERIRQEALEQNRPLEVLEQEFKMNGGGE
jgi:phage terminase small subunit